jgi:hypothetical protein
MYIDTSYFYNLLNLPQAGNTEGEQDVENFIDQYESEYLACVLGLSLYRAFVTGTEGSGVPAERWANLLNGGDFTYKSCLYNWPGFAPSAPAQKISPIANYVFFKYVSNKTTDFTLVGEVASTTDNNRNVSPVDRLTEVWNRMVDLNKLLYQYLKANKSVYPEWQICWPGCSCGCGCDKCAPSGCEHLLKKINSLGF